MVRLIGLLSILALLAACEGPSTAVPPPAPDRMLGTLDAIYPYYTAQGEWLLEYRLTKDTVFVSYQEARAKVQDSAWKSALTHSVETFYDNGQGCMYARSVTGCLPFLETVEESEDPAALSNP